MQVHNRILSVKRRTLFIRDTSPSVFSPFWGIFIQTIHYEIHVFVFFVRKVTNIRLRYVLVRTPVVFSVCVRGIRMDGWMDLLL